MKKDISIVCGVNHNWIIDEPWNVGGYTYATDGKIVLRRATEESDTDRTARPYPVGADKFAWGIKDKIARPVPIPQITVDTANILSFKMLDCIRGVISLGMVVGEGEHRACFAVHYLWVARFMGATKLHLSKEDWDPAYFIASAKGDTVEGLIMPMRMNK